MTRLVGVRCTAPAVAPPTLLAALLAYRAVHYGLALAAALAGDRMLESRPVRVATANRGNADQAVAVPLSSSTAGAQLPS